LDERCVIGIDEDSSGGYFSLDRSIAQHHGKAV
jgi:hypothetical protein